MDKKGNAAAITILIIIIVIGGIAWLVNIANKECRQNEDCRANQYCGSDFQCHDFPAQTKKVYEINLVVPALILGGAIVLASVLLRMRKEPPQGGANQPPELQTSEHSSHV